jgi:acyl carrier protein
MKTFNELVMEVLKIPEGAIRDDLSPADIPEWDSMNYLIFISRLEEGFNMSFTMDEVLQAKTLGDVRKIVEERGKK